MRPHPRSSPDTIASPATLAAISDPRVSVIICAYTEERWNDIVSAIASARAQTCPADEVLLIVDHNERLLERARGLDATVLPNTETRGLAGARNSGIAAATGDVIAFLDDDARAGSDWLEHLVRPYADKQVLGVGGHIEVVWSSRAPRWFPAEFNWVVGCTYRGMPTRDGTVRNMIGANMSMRRQVFDEVGGFSSSLGRVGKLPVGCEETELCIRASQHWPEGRFIHEPRAKVWHRQPASRATWRYFWSRCYAEGRSKAILARLIGRGDGLASERTYTMRVLPAGVLRGMRDTITGDLAGAARSAAIVGGLLVTSLGFMVGSMGSARRVAVSPAVGEATPALPVAPQLVDGSRRRIVAQASSVATFRAFLDDWGWLPALALTSALGLLAVSGGYIAARRSEPALPLYWLGIALIVLPALVRLLSAVPKRRERIGIVVLVTTSLYLMKVMYSPLAFVFPDELQHLRTAEDLLATGRLFSENPILRISPLFPGLENVTAALASISGLPVFESGLLVIAATRLTIALGAFLLFEQASGSSRMAGIATFVYMANPSFIHFGAQFVYESLALPLAVVVLYLTARRPTADPTHRVGLTIILLVVAAAVIVTHHASSGVLAAILVGWAVIVALRERLAGVRERLGPIGPALIVGVGIIGWVAYVAEIALAYLGPYLGGSVQQFLRLLGGELGDRVLFASTVGSGPPALEQLASFAGVGLLLLALPIGLFWVWRRHRAKPLVVMLAFIAALYPGSLWLRLTAAGQDVAGRASPWLFLGLALMVALAVGETWKRRVLGRVTRLALVGLGALIFASGVVVGLPFYARLPGPYIVGGESRAIEPQSVGAARWALAQLGPGNRVVADRTNRLLMASYGEQYTVSSADTEARISDLFISPGVGAAEIEFLSRGAVDYVVIDRRLSDALPALGIYFERGEVKRTSPLDAARLSKFDHVPGVSRVFDSGDIQVYDVRRLSHAN